MAGSFRYEEGRYDVTKACGERVLFTAVCGASADDWSSPPASAAATRSPTSDNRRSLAQAGLLATVG